MVINIALDQVKAKLGQIPVLLRVDLGICPYETETNRLRLYRMYRTWEIGDSSARYWDLSATEPWYEDTYAPYPGQDRESSPTYLGPAGQQLTANERVYMTITSIVERALRDNTDIMLYFWPSENATTWWWKPTITSRRPTLECYYIYPIEFFESDGANAPDYSSNVAEGEDGHYYLGAVERGATGSPVQGWIRNFTTTTQQVELFDDHPEWITPIQRAGTGTGELDYVTLATNATSQLYTAVFYSSTQYEVKAEAYRDNSTSYHPQINADGSWRSDVSSNFTSPSGGLTIPAVAWQGNNINSGDEFEIAVRGNTTDTAWPADSNQQVEITKDNAGVADATAWRPVLGHRERTTDSVTTDATTKFFPLRHVTPADWSVGDPCFIHNASNINEGSLDSVQERNLDSVTFTGSGLNDCTNSGNYNGVEDKQFRVEIDGTGSPDTFKWSNDNGGTWEATTVNITGSAQLLEDGVYVTFAATTGHTSTDRWDFDADTWGVTVSGLTNNSDNYNPGAYVAQTLPIRDLGVADWSTVSAASGASESPASRVYVEDTTPFTQNDVLHIQQVQSGGVYETATIAAGGVNASGGYLDLTTSLVNDYTIGDFVTVVGTGEAAFWMRPVANSTTVEELKQLRFNARIL
jgi:hypothetical protein